MPENNVNLGEKLLSIESIYKWKPVIYEENVNETICEYEPQSDYEFNFFNFVLNLMKSYMTYKQNDRDSAFEIINDLELAAAKFTDGEDFKRIEDSYYHMVYASKIYLLGNNHEEVPVLLERINPVDEMDNCNRAAIHAMKSAAFALYSNEEMQKALASIEKALKLDPDNARWHFLKGVYKQKERRIVNPFRMPFIIEKDSFEKAFEKDPNNVVYKLSVADYYREISAYATKRKENCSNFMPRDHSFNENLRENVDSKIPLAAQYYKEAAEQYPDCPYVMFRCAEGLAKLPQTVSDVKLSKKLAKDGLKKNPDNVAGNLVMAFLCENIDKNTKEAQKYLKKCQEKQIFRAEMNMIRLLHATKPEKFDCAEALQLLLEKYKEKPSQAILYSQIVSYHVFTKYDLVKACDYAIKAFSLGCTSSCMEVHRSCFLPPRDPFSLIDVLVDQVRYVMNGQKTSDEIKLTCEKFIQYMNFQNIPIMKGFPQNLRQQILQGKTLNPNMNSQSPRKPGRGNNNASRRKSNAGRGDATRNGNPQGNNYGSQTSNKADSNQNKKPPSQNKVERLPSLMDTPVVNPAPRVEEKREPEPEKKPTAKIEKPKEESPEECKNDSADDSDEKKMILKVYELIKKQKKAQQEKKSKDRAKSHKSRDSDENDDELVRKVLDELGIGDKKSARKKKKHYSDSEESSESDSRRRKDRRRDRSRRRYRSESDSDDSSRHRRRHNHHRRHRRHSSTDSDYSSRSYRHKSHKKDRHRRDTSPRDRRHRRNRSRSFEEDIGLKGKSLRHRDDSISSETRRRGRGDKSISPERRMRDREDSVSSRSTRNRSPPYDKRRAADRKETKAKSHVKSHRRDSSRDRCENRSKNDSKSKKEHDSDSLVRNDRDQKSPRKHYDQSDSE